MYYKGKWCTAGGKDPLFGHVDGFQIDPNQSFLWNLLRTAAADFSFLFCLLTKFAYRVIIVSKLTISILIIEVLYG